jgi:hypothetical protein
MQLRIGQVILQRYGDQVLKIDVTRRGEDFRPFVDLFRYPC